MTRLGEVTFNVAGVSELHAQLANITRRLDAMAVDQAAFDVALTAFLDDLTAGLAAIQAKLDSLGTPVDFTAELAQIQAAKDALDAQVAADTA